MWRSLHIFSVLALLGACQPRQSVDRAVSGPSGERPPSNPGTGGRSPSAHASGGTSGTGGAGGPESDAAAAPGAPSPGDNQPSADAAAVAQPQGAACTTNTQCQSGACADGVCCNTACLGPCQACDVAGQEGTCTPVPKGQDPDDECAMEPASSCHFDGTCDGQGACAHYAAGTVCLPGSCTGGVERAGGTCNGQGQCTSGATQACRSGVCAGSSCGDKCTANEQCQAGFFCDAGTCKGKRGLAASCTMDPQCASGHCVDQVCCATDCSQGCYACNLAGSAGTCIAVADGQDPGKECSAEAASTCGRAGGCNGRGSCKLFPMGTPCGAALCSDAIATSAKVCSGTGQCQAGTTKPCGDFACKGNVCATTCTTGAECKDGLTCSGGACVLAPASKLGSLQVLDTANAAGWSAQKDFQIGSAGAHPWTDWPDSYVASIDAAAAGLAGSDWVKVTAASKKYQAGPQAMVTLNATADVYLAVDDRWGNPPAWLAGWSNSKLKLRVFESASKSFPFTLYVKTGQTGTVSVPAIGDNNGYDYFIIVK